MLNKEQMNMYREMRKNFNEYDNLVAQMNQPDEYVFTMETFEDLLGKDWKSELKKRKKTYAPEFEYGINMHFWYIKFDDTYNIDDDNIDNIDCVIGDMSGYYNNIPVRVIKLIYSPNNRHYKLDGYCKSTNTVYDITVIIGTEIL